MNDAAFATIKTALAFQRSVILSGEYWTETAAAVESEAYAALSRLRSVVAAQQAALDAIIDLPERVYSGSARDPRIAWTSVREAQSIARAALSSVAGEQEA